MAKSIFYWSILIIVYLLTSIFLIAPISAINSPLDTFEDVFKTTLYGFVFSGAIFTLLFYTIKISFYDLILNFKTWTNLGISIKLKGGKNTSLRKIIFTLFFLGEFVLLGTIPLYINEYYTSADPDSFNATVIEKKITHSRRNSQNIILKIQSEAGASSDIGSLFNVYNKLELNDFITIVTRRGLLGINYYVAIYKNGELIYS